MKITNEYVDSLGRLYSDTPKAVFAALCVSLLIRLDGEGRELHNDAILDEWLALYQNGIVPQKPPR